MKHKFAAIILLLLPTLFISQAACRITQPVAFGIYLVDTGKLVLSQDDVKTYDANLHSFVLNEKGISSWNPFQTWVTSAGVPVLKQSLFKRDFVIKIDGQQVAAGKFYSGLSSASLSGLAILDSSVKMSNQFDTLWLISNYPGASLGTDYGDLASKLKEVFQNLNRLS